MNQELDELVRVISRMCDRDITRYDDAFLAKSLEKRLTATGSETVAAYLGRLVEDRAEAVAFCNSLTITYSEFFRNPHAFALLEALVLPGLAHEKGKAGRAEIRVWSAGCAGG